MSAFTRLQPLDRAPVDVGTRPGLHGQTLLSTGLADLDRLLGGGLPLGALFLVLEDPHSAQHLPLIKYFLSEGLACGHAACWLAPRPVPGGPAAFLPPVAADKRSSASASGGPASSSDAPAAGPGGQASDGDDGLRIAWRYRQYIKQHQQHSAAAAAVGTMAVPGRAAAGATSGTSAFKRAGDSGDNVSSSSGSAGGGGGSGGSRLAPGAGVRPATAPKALSAGVAREWCHRFDATKGVGDAAIAASRLNYRAEWGPAPGVELAAEALTFVADLRPPGLGAAAAGATQGPPTLLPPREPGRVGRLVVQSLGSGAWRGSCDGWRGAGSGGGGVGGGEASDGACGGEWETELLRTVAQLRMAVQDAHCAALITCPAGGAPHAQGPRRRGTGAHGCTQLLPPAGRAAAPCDAATPPPPPPC
jgi:elongator complex protein 4